MADQFYPYQTNNGLLNDYTSVNKPRMRVSKACDRCRGQKIKCSGTYPCNTCLKHKKECRFLPLSMSTGGHIDEPAHKKAKISSSELMLGAPGRTFNSSMHDSKVMTLDSSIKDNYVLQLENRVKYLESLLSNDSTTLFRTPTVAGKDTEHWFTILSLLSKWRFLRRHQNLLTVSFANFIHRNLSPENQMKVQLPRAQYFGWNMSGVHYIKSESLPDLPDFNVELPLSHEQYIDYFFKEINSLFAILHETVFRAQVKKYFNLNEDSLKPNGEMDLKLNQTSLFLAIYYLVVALSLRLLEFQKPLGPSLDVLKVEEQMFKYGYRVVEILLFEWELFELIQLWILILLYLRIAHRQTLSFAALGRVVTMVRLMGLAYNIPATFNATPYELLKAKRVFWCVYTMDRIFGAQQGRYCGIRDEDIYRSFPSFDFEQETKDEDWWTLPAFAMAHVARILNFVYTLVNDTPHPEKSNQVNTELDKLDRWFDANGFADDEIYQTIDGILPLVKVQTKLHFYDLVLSIHGRILFNYIGSLIPNEGLDLERVINACERTISLLKDTESAGLLFTPWYIVCLLLFNVGVNSLVLINAGVQIKRCKDIFRSVVKLIQILTRANVINEQTGKLLTPERFKMSKECLWGLKTLNKLVLFRFQEDVNELKQIGVDHGSAEVNKQQFNQFGKFVDKEEEYFTGNEDLRSEQVPEESDTPNSLDNAMLSNKLITDELLGNLQWFDQWLDFEYNM